MKLYPAIAAALLFALPVPAQAQNWATRAVCDGSNPRIVAETYAPSTPAEVAAAAQDIPNGVGKLWRITGADDAVSHLWGTMYSTQPAVLDLPIELTQQIESARMVAMEADYTFPSRADYTRYMQNDDRYTDDIYASALRVIPDTPVQIHDWITRRLVGMGWEKNAPEYLTPGALAELLLAEPCDDFTTGVISSQDNLIQTYSAIAGAQIMGLEAPDAFTDKLNDPANRHLAEAMIAVHGAYLNPALTEGHTATNLALYLEGRLAESIVQERVYMQSIFGADRAKSLLMQVDNYLITQRNIEFSDRLHNQLLQGGVVISVGYFNLPGETGMIELLREAGFTVERLPLPGEAP